MADDKSFNYSLNLPCSPCEDCEGQMQTARRDLCHQSFRKDELHNALIWCRLPVDLLARQRKRQQRCI